MCNYVPRSIFEHVLPRSWFVFNAKRGKCMHFKSSILIDHIIEPIEDYQDKPNRNILSSNWVRIYRRRCNYRAGGRLFKEFQSSKTRKQLNVTLLIGISTWVLWLISDTHDLCCGSRQVGKGYWKLLCFSFWSYRFFLGEIKHRVI